jgi:hypothetical protein
MWRGPRGLDGQQLIVVPEYDMVTVFTGWDFLPSEENVRMTGLLAHSTQQTGSMAA